MNDMNDRNNDDKAVSGDAGNNGEIDEAGKTGEINGIAVSADKKMHKKEKTDKDNLYIRIDVRYFKISFHKATLESIGNPEYIRVGYHSKTKRLVIFSAGENIQRAVRLRFKKDGSGYVHSKWLLSEIRKADSVLTEDGSYLLKGKRLDSIPAVVFPLENIQTMKEEHELILPETDEGNDDVPAHLE